MVRQVRIWSVLLCWTTAVLCVALAFPTAARAAASNAAPVQQSKSNAKLGINLAGISDWSTELPFADLMKSSRDWVSQKDGVAWGQGPKLSLDADGWVAKLDPGCAAERLLITGTGAHCPRGDYVLLYDGRGRFEFNGATVVSSAPGRCVVKLNSSDVSLRVKATDPANYMRNIRFLLPGTEATYQANPFNPAFLARWNGIACIRFMDWMATNGSEQSAWTDRPKPSDASYMDKGVPVEVMVALANRLGADAWFCMPVKADDGYIRGFASYAKANLAPSRKAYLEYSNECWNSQFPQTHWLDDKAVAFGLGDKSRPWEGGGMLYAKRAVQIFKIWTDVFGGHDRLVRVIAWQCGSNWWIDNILVPAISGSPGSFDAFALAPYMALTPSPDSTPSADQIAKWSTDQVLSCVEQNALPQAIQNLRAMKSEADKYHVKLVAYEAGQHLVGIQGAENNAALTSLFMEANSSPRMGMIYDKYFEAWRSAGGSLICNFSSTGAWSKWGSWGVFQYADDDPAKSPKFQALVRFSRNCGQTLGTPQ